MTQNQIMFLLFSGIILVFSILTVTSRRILRAAVYLLFVLLATSALYFMLNYQFLAAVQLTVYAGGIIVLIIFSILLTSQISERIEKAGLKKVIFSAIASVAGALACITAILQFKFQARCEPSADVNMKRIGFDLLGYGPGGYSLPFEVISVLLLAAMVAAIVIAKREKK
jgi:NADH-quinone oxidoreductase subunit J